jgi:hypothetical protein
MVAVKNWRSYLRYADMYTKILCYPLLRFPAQPSLSVAFPISLLVKNTNNGGGMRNPHYLSYLLHRCW